MALSPVLKEEYRQQENLPTIVAFSGVAKQPRERERVM
jgi:hypothetical protein